MSQADELINNLTGDDISMYARESNMEGHIIIGGDRFIHVPDSLKRIAVQYDHNVETVTFDCPRYWDGLDMSEMGVRINYLLANGQTGQYVVDDVSIDEADLNIMHFTWSIDSNVTVASGRLSFLVCIVNEGTDGSTTNHWNSELNSDMYISEGLEGVPPIVEQYPDVITQLLTRMSNVEADAMTKVYVDERRVAAIEKSMTDKGDVSNALIVEKSGGAIVIDIADLSPISKKISVISHIETTQDGEPTMADPKPINTRSSITLTRGSKNLIKFPYLESDNTYNGITFQVLDKETIRATGTCTDTSSNVSFEVGKVKVRKGVAYVLSGNCNSVTGAHNTHQLWVSGRGVLEGDYLYNVKDPKTFTPIADGEIDIRITCYPGNNFADLTYRPQLEIGTVATPYEAYKAPTEITFNLGQEIYGGSFDWNTGKLLIDTYVLDANGVTYDEWYADKTGTLVYQGGWGHSAAMSTENYPCFCWNISKTLYPEVDTSRIKEHRCSHFINYRTNHDTGISYVGDAVGFNGYGTQDNYWNYFYFKVSKALLQEKGYSADSDGWYKYLKDIAANGEPLRLAYKMLEPIEIQLTPQQIEELDSTTALSSDTGSTDVTYNRDINNAFIELKQAILALTT